MCQPAYDNRYRTHGGLLTKNRAGNVEYARHRYLMFVPVPSVIGPAHGTAIAARAGMITPAGGRRRDWIGRVVLTIVVGCGTSGTVVCVSAALRATDHIVRVDNAVGELSHFIADAHASMRERVAALEPIDPAVAAFDEGVERRIARIRGLNIVGGDQGGAVWTRQVTDDVDIRRIEAERRAYVTAAITTAATAADDRATSLRRFDLHAQKLMQTIEAVRDTAETARARALADADAMVVLALGIGGLVIAYLIWFPMAGGASTPTGVTPIRTTRISRFAALF
jgi:hypothetical protein